MDSTQYPTLATLLNRGYVWVEGMEYYGKAADGEEVGLGMVGCEDQIERYLAEHGPSAW